MKIKNTSAVDRDSSEALNDALLTMLHQGIALNYKDILVYNIGMDVHPYIIEALDMGLVHIPSTDPESQWRELELVDGCEHHGEILDENVHEIIPDSFCWYGG